MAYSDPNCLQQSACQRLTRYAVCYKIMPLGWSPSPDKLSFVGTAKDIQDGFLHTCINPTQLESVLAKHFPYDSQVVILVINLAHFPLFRLKMESVTSSGERYLHIYGGLDNVRIEAVYEQTRRPSDGKFDCSFFKSQTFPELEE